MTISGLSLRVVGKEKKRDRESNGSESEILNKNNNVKISDPSEDNISASEIHCATNSILFFANIFHLKRSFV